MALYFGLIKFSAVVSKPTLSLLVSCDFFIDCCFLGFVILVLSQTNFYWFTIFFPFLFFVFCRAQLFEQFCAQKFNTSKRFGIDGCETAIVMLKGIVKKAVVMGVDSIVMGMPHRGRLNTLVNVLHKPMEQMMREFQVVMSEDCQFALNQFALNMFARVCMNSGSAMS